MGQRRDEADLLPGLLQPDIARRPARALGQVDQREPLGQAGAQVG
jgi:hypothetical protein